MRTPCQEETQANHKSLGLTWLEPGARSQKKRKRERKKREREKERRRERERKREREKEREREREKEREKEREREREKERKRKRKKERERKRKKEKERERKRKEKERFFPDSLLHAGVRHVRKMHRLNHNLGDTPDVPHHAGGSDDASGFLLMQWSATCSGEPQRLKKKWSQTIAGTESMGGTQECSRVQIRQLKSGVDLAMQLESWNAYRATGRRCVEAKPYSVCVAAAVSFTNHPRHPKTLVHRCFGSCMFFGCSSATFSVRTCFLVRVRCFTLELCGPPARLLLVCGSLHVQRPAIVDLPKGPSQVRLASCVLLWRRLPCSHT